METPTDDAVRVAARLGDYVTVKRYLDAGGDPNLMTVAIYGPATLLHAVIQYDMENPWLHLRYDADGVAILTDPPPPRRPDPIAKLLVNSGADLQARDSCGMTVEYYIRKSGYSSHYSFLLDS